MSSFPLNSSAAAAIVARRQEDWPEPDVSILEDKRGAVPPFPLDLLAQPWRDWVSDTASSAGAPADYVVQAVLAALAGLCGAGVAVRVTPAWSEPMVLWQAVVGEASSGKSSALASMRRLLGSIEAERRVHDDVRVVVADTALETIAEIVSGNPRGVILWRDEPAWLAQLGDAGKDGSDRARWLEAWNAGSVTLKRRTDKSSLQLERFPVSILATTPPDRLKEVLEEGDDGPAARFLYAWPGPQPYCPLANGKIAQDDDALRMLRRIGRLARTPDDPLVLSFDQRGVEAFDGFLAGLHADRRRTEGLEAAWLGKGVVDRGAAGRRAGVARLVGHRRAGSARPYRPRAGRGRCGAVDGLFPAARPRGVRPRGAVGLRSSGKARGALAQGRRRDGRVARGHQAQGARPGRECRATPTRCSTVCTSSASSAPIAVTTSEGPGRPARRWLVNPALADA